MPAPKIKKYESKCLRTKFNDIPVHTFSIKIKDVVALYYVAVRGVDEEDGAVQRVLNKRRIRAIKDYVLGGNIFFNTFILNWTNNDHLPVYKDGEIVVPVVPSSAQVIDGQHRLAGLEEAMNEKPEIGNTEILVSLCIGLSTSQAAKIFLNINTEQKPVPKSLIYDLFGEVSDDKDHAINRANDIANELNENDESPYYGLIKYPGAPRGVGLIDLSTVVASLKDHVAKDGTLARINMKSLDYQKQAILNYFSAIKSFYDEGDFWLNKQKNPFLKGAGFSGALDYLFDRLIEKCAEEKSFKVNNFKKHLRLDDVGLIFLDEIKGLDGKTARKTIRAHLETNTRTGVPDQDDYEF